MIQPSSSERGSALILALIATFLLLIVSFEVAHTTRIEAFITKNVEVDFKLEVACRSGLERALAILREDRQNTEIDSLNDNWAQLFVDTELTEADIGSSEFLRDDDPEEAQAQTTLYIEIFDEAAKFNIYSLRSDDEAERRKRRERFGTLIDKFREDEEGDMSVVDGVSMAEQLTAFLERTEERPYHNVPVPPTKAAGGMNDVAELLYVDGFTPVNLWDRATEDGEHVIPGLFRFLTIWSDMQVNINTAPLATLASVFDPKYAYLADRIMDYREQSAEEREREKSRASETGSFDPNKGKEEQDPSGGAPFSQINDLREKVEGLGQDVYNEMQAFVTVQSTTFSVFVTAERGLLRRTKMFVVRRSEKGFQICLEKPVDFPYLIPRDRRDQGAEQAEDRLGR